MITKIINGNPNKGYDELQPIKLPGKKLVRYRLEDIQGLLDDKKLK